ncbi:MAG: hypothetical protein A2904_01140 [Candidatus Staskawiczbacteria bacterium RIFCSPLOWO2_01_FULL_33_9]|uniref:Helix-turn-helix domain-containing protein n=1 Tax=Candidatus Staskawiczbacteria bacterium RIFCSPLOWO2_01_FULL_33_9 TaxID=1802211 RepID=A0A1G2I642_9BACT|nr:MAG: hypothetical protein A2904_01140 [Candidatus Staskawiczbacteria bacterium RIFCSPLOWO2_01_FULL_33_9]
MPNYNLNLITARRSYSVNEISALLGISRKTCGRWIKYEGLKMVEENTSPLLIIGADLIHFIKKKREKRKIPLKENEFLCFKCHKAVRAKTGSEREIKTGKRIGKDNREQMKKTGACEICNTKLNKLLGV